MVDLEGKHVVLAYSGGLDTSVILHWLINQKKARVSAFMADVGQGEELEPAREKAIALGAECVRVVDIRDEFVRDFVYPAIRADVRYEGRYLLGTSLARPVTAKAHVAVALGVAGSESVILSHGATEKGNDQIRFELAWKVLAPKFGIYTPWKDLEFSQQFRGGRKAMQAYAAQHGIPVVQTAEQPWSSDANLAHISYEGGILEDPNVVPPDHMFRLTKSPRDAPDVETIVEIMFRDCNPIKVKGIQGPPVPSFVYLDQITNDHQPVEILQYLNHVAGENGVGRIDIVESRATGMKSRGVYEAPGVTVLMFAHERVYLQAQIDASQEFVSGVVKVGLYKGNMFVRGRTSPNSLYKPKLASMDEAGT